MFVTEVCVADDHSENVLKYFHSLSTFSYLSVGAPDWRKIAEELGCNKEIPIWEQNGNGGRNVIQVYKTRGKTVGDLYEMLYRMNRNDIVKCMEDLKYTLPLSERN